MGRQLYRVPVELLVEKKRGSKIQVSHLIHNPPTAKVPNTKYHSTEQPVSRRILCSYIMPSTRNYIPVSTSAEGEDTVHPPNQDVNTVYYLVIFVQAVVIVALTLAALRHPYAASADSARQVLVYCMSRPISAGVSC